MNRSSMFISEQPFTENRKEKNRTPEKPEVRILLTIKKKVKMVSASAEKKKR